MKKCPFCAEEIQDEATVCRFCGRSAMNQHIQSLAMQWAKTRRGDRSRIWAGMTPADRVLLTEALKGQAGNSAPRRSFGAASACGVVVLLGIIGIIGLVILGQFAPGADPENNAEGSDRKKSDASYTCQQFVKQLLKAPASAKFCSHRDITVAYADSVYRIAGCVDAENSFGAKLRNRYTCTLRPSGDKWLLEEISVQ